jgi:hypothetical protein
MSERLDLNTLSQQLGIRLRNSNSGAETSNSNQSQPETASIVELAEDSQPVETNPFFKMVLLGGLLFSTLGVGLIVLLWGAGSNNQQAKKPDSLPTEQTIAPEQQKEVADLKAQVVMEQQKLDASRLAAAKNPTPIPTPKPTQVKTLPIQQQLATAKPVAKMQPSSQDTAQLAALIRAKQQQTTELGKLIDQVQKERQNLATLRKQRNSTKLAKTYSPQPTRVAQRQAIAANYRPTTPKQQEMNWEEASALANYGGNPEPELTGNNPSQISQAVNPAANSLAISPILRLPVGQVVAGKLVTPFYTLIGNGDGQQTSQKASATVTLDQAIEVGSGWHLPVGTAIEFDFQVADNGMIQAVSKKVTYENTEIAMEPGAFIITGNDNQPVFAQIKEVNTDKLASADLRAAIFGGAAEVGNALVNGGNNTSVTIGLGTTIASTNNGNPNILGAVFKGAFSPLAQTQVSRAQTLANRLDKQSKVGYLTPGTTMRVYVALATTFQIPTDSNLTQASNPFQTVNGYTPAPKIVRIDPYLSPSAPPTPINRSEPSSVTMHTQPTITQAVVTPVPTNTPSPAIPNSIDTQPTVKVDPVPGQLVIQTPTEVRVQIPPVQLPKSPVSIPSIFPH